MRRLATTSRGIELGMPGLYCHSFVSRPPLSFGEGSGDKAGSASALPLNFDDRTTISPHNCTTLLELCTPGSNSVWGNFNFREETMVQALYYKQNFTQQNLHYTYVDTSLNGQY